MSQRIILYGHPGCPQVPVIAALLEKSGIEFEYINIRIDDKARQRVREINSGYEIVPTLVFPDGSNLTEPSGKELRAKLKQNGYPLNRSTWVQGFLDILKRNSKFQG